MAGTIVIIIITLVMVVLVFMPACNKVSSVLLSEDNQYIRSFEDFVNMINDMPDYKDTTGRNNFLLKLKKESAIIGFSEDSEHWVCKDCDPARTYNKPTTPNCKDSACACLCIEGFEFDDENNGRCETLMCKTLEKDIMARIEIPNNKYWDNGFLFATHIADANGLEEFKGKDLTLFVDNKDSKIGVCNEDILKYHEELRGFSGCINAGTTS